MELWLSITTIQLIILSYIIINYITFFETVNECTNTLVPRILKFIQFLLLNLQFNFFIYLFKVIQIFLKMISFKIL